MSANSPLPKVYTDVAIALAHPYYFETMDATGNQMSGHRDIARYRLTRTEPYMSNKSGLPLDICRIAGMSIDTLEHYVKEGDIILLNRGFDANSLTNKLFEYKTELAKSGVSLINLRTSINKVLSDSAKSVGLKTRFSYNKKSVFPTIRLLFNKGWAANIVLSPITENSIQLVPLLGHWSVATPNNTELASNVLPILFKFKAELENKGFTVTI